MENLGVMRAFKDFKFYKTAHTDRLNIYFM